MLLQWCATVTRCSDEWRPPPSQHIYISTYLHSYLSSYLDIYTPGMLVLVTVVAAASVARAQDKPRVGQDGRPLLNKPKVGGEQSQGSSVQCSTPLPRWRCAWTGSTTRSTASTTTSCRGGNPGTSSRTGTGSTRGTSAESAAWTWCPSRVLTSTDTLPSSCSKVVHSPSFLSLWH